MDAYLGLLAVPVMSGAWLAMVTWRRARRVRIERELAEIRQKILPLLDVDPPAPAAVRAVQRSRMAANVSLSSFANGSHTRLPPPPRMASGTRPPTLTHSVIAAARDGWFDDERTEFDDFDTSVETEAYR